MTISQLQNLKVSTPLVEPVFFDLSIAEEFKSFKSLISDNPHLKVNNQIESQLMELMKISHPKEKFTDAELLTLAENHVGQSNFMTYGNWVFYPWLNSVVHLLPEAEFIQVRTSRNNYKISPEEQQKLATKKVGVVGLSVGQSIALTMAMERTAGEIRITDFDTLELTNLNRIRAGVHELGLPKVAIVAREIAQIDPYLKVKTYWNGLTEENINQFLNENGKLDLVADECDTIHVKFLIRQVCTKQRIPVIMDTSDRGMLDIERFDLEPDRDIFHGKVNHLDIEKSKYLKTTEEKIAYTLPIIGLENASSRIKASMLEIDESITTWPQLASDVTLGGAISTNAIRRIFLDQFTSSGRFYVDTNDIIKDESHASDSEIVQLNAKVPPLRSEELEALTKQFILHPERTSPSELVEKHILKSALYAPSGANCQPWKWLVKDNAYFLFHDKHYSQSFNDFRDLASHLTMGCASENFILAAQNSGYEVLVHPNPFGEEHQLKAVFQLLKQATPETEPRTYLPLANYIFDRHTNRNKSKPTIISSQDLEELESSAASVNGVKLRFLSQTENMNALAELVAVADKLKMLHPQSHQELFSNELRLTEEENLKHRDGIDIGLVDVTPTEKVGFQICADSQVMTHLQSWGLGNGLGKMSKELIKDSSAIGFMTIDKNSYQDFYNGGRAVERVWLKATELNYGFQPMTVLPYLFTRLTLGKGEGLDQEQKSMLTHLWLRFNALFPCSENDGLLFLFRLSEAETPTKQSLRRPIHDLIHYKK